MKQYLWAALCVTGGVCLGVGPAAAAEDLTWCKRAVASQEAKNYEQAIGEINRCIDTGHLVDSNLAVALHNRGIALAETEHPEDAIDDFTASLRLRPDAPNTHFRRGHAFHVMGQLKVAIEDYTTVLRIDPNDSGAYLYRGAAWHDMGQFARAVDDYTFVLKLDPNDLDAYFARAKAYESMGLLELAEKDRQASRRR